MGNRRHLPTQELGNVVDAVDLVIAAADHPFAVAMTAETGAMMW